MRKKLQEFFKAIIFDSSEGRIIFEKCSINTAGESIGIMMEIPCFIFQGKKADAS